MISRKFIQKNILITSDDDDDDCDGVDDDNDDDGSDDDDYDFPMRFIAMSCSLMFCGNMYR